MSNNVHFIPSILKLAKDSFIFVEGKPNADKFYIVKEGKVRIVRENEDLYGSVMNPGDIFGVISVMAGHGYITSAVAITDVTLLVIERKQYGDLVRKTNSIAMKNIKTFSLRLRELNNHLSERMLKSTFPTDSSLALYQIGEYYEKKRKINHAVYAYHQYTTHCPNTANAQMMQRIADVKKKIEELQPYITVDRPFYPENTMMQTYPSDCLLFAEGEKGNNLYIIQSGSVKITKIVNNQEIVLAVLKKSDIFGEMAMLDDKPRAATAEVYQSCTLLAVNKDNFSKLIQDQPDMVVKLTSLMAERIWLLYRQLDNTFIEEPLGRLYDALIIQLEKNRVDLMSRDSYLCSFGYKELMGMAGLAVERADGLYSKFMESKKVTVVEDRLQVTNVSDAFKEAEYFRNMQKKENAIKESKTQMA
ncbi:MAG: cyclic nucleotide-binding domain-containing protein [Treponema sp.]|nr:cyclic nucleotide-binding domain-containing protein [Treponema sp.]